MAGQLTTPEDIKQLGTILTVWAHPDDETFLAGGLLATAVANGQKVVCVTATRGEVGTSKTAEWPAERLGPARTKELEAALRILGIQQHYWLDCRDGCCADADTGDMVNSIVKIAQQYKPDTIITFGPDGWTGHPDHCCVSDWVSKAAGRFTVQPHIYHVVVEADSYKNYLKTIDESLNVYFNIQQPPLEQGSDCDICLKLPEALARQKVYALRAFTTQTGQMFSSFDDKFLTDAWSVEAFVKA